MAANASRNHPGPRGRYRPRSAGACQPRPTRSVETPVRRSRPTSATSANAILLSNGETRRCSCLTRATRGHTPRSRSSRSPRVFGTFGFTNPVLTDAAGGIIAGHGRVEAAKLARSCGRADSGPVSPNSLIPRSAPTSWRTTKSAELAGWDPSLLALELKDLTEINLDFEIEVTGFETVDIDLIIAGAAQGEADAEEEIAVDPDEGVTPVTRLGDLWELGPHWLLCADALKAESYEQLLQGQKVQMVFTDPPYNVPVNGHVCGSGRIKHEEFVMAAGEMSEPQFSEFLTTVFSQLARFSIDGSIHFHCMDWRHIQELMTAGRAVYSQLKNLCVSNAGMGSFFRSQHELIFVFKNGTAPHINNFGLGERGRYRTNLWTYPGVNTFKSGRLDELEIHPTVKPLALVADAIKDLLEARRHHLGRVLGGRDEPIIAAEPTGRHGYALRARPEVRVDIARCAAGRR